jgi:DNA-binding CsgD family transcriptional regulator
VDDLDPFNPRHCSEYWRREFTISDVNHFSDIARSPRPVATLRAAAADPERSDRYHSLLQPLGFGDELRAVFRAGGNPWGTLTLWRHVDEPPFSAGETALVASLSAPIGEALRRCARPDDDVATLVGIDGPGLMTFNLAGNLVSADESARARLAELPREHCLPTDLEVDVPVWLVGMVFRAAAVANGVGDGTARARVRLQGGRWLVCHASCPQGADNSFSTVVVVIEPASPAEIVPIVIEAYDLTNREREITRLVARGRGTADIAAELYLSAHTVRDHLKAIFQKVGVSSRGELVAKVFADHYEPLHLRHGHTTDAA